jgi:hypothetical protein
MNNHDARFFTLLDVGKRAGFAFKYNVALISPVGLDPGQYLHKRGFSRAVFTDKGVYFALFYQKVNIVKGFHARKGFGYVFHFKQRGLIRHKRSLKS